MGTPFISRDDLSDYMGQDVTTDDGALIVVDAACEIVRERADQPFDQGTVTEYIDGSGIDSIVLRYRPVNTVGTVQLLASSGTTTVTDYTTRADGVLLRVRGSATGSTYYWPSGRQNVKVTYSYGYGTVPEDVRFVALSLATRMLVQGSRGGAIGENTGNTSIRYAGAAMDLTTGEKAIIDKYRQVAV